ncbi:MAG: hypothetical protein H7306_14065 [Bacteriovorax sp.]|nr:hypothetical protein [Rhizobacter sp.]
MSRNLPSLTTHRPEHWSADAGLRDVAQLDIPADAHRERNFEIFCRLVVANKAARTDATHGMRVLVNGALEWTRTVPTPSGDNDSLDLRLRRTVPVGRPLRLTATSELRGALRVSLTISAEEE